MAPLYPRRAQRRFGNQTEGRASPPTARAKPLKRPLQARSKFTVQAIYDAFVRIWRLHGWDGVTTRAVALETGVSVGTLYEYFPNKQALLSGYVRHCIDALLAEIDRQVIAVPGLAWQLRVQRLVRLTCGVAVDELPYFDAGMLAVEHQFAEAKHHRRVYEELSAKWCAAIAACADLPRQPDADTVRALFLSVWGGRRHFLLAGPADLAAGRWAEEMEQLCRARLLAMAPDSATPARQPG